MFLHYLVFQRYLHVVYTHHSVVALFTAILPVTNAWGLEYEKGTCGTCWVGTDPLLGRWLLFYIPQVPSTVFKILQ